MPLRKSVFTPLVCFLYYSNLILGRIGYSVIAYDTFCHHSCSYWRPQSFLSRRIYKFRPLPFRICWVYCLQFKFVAHLSVFSGYLSTTLFKLWGGNNWRINALIVTPCRLWLTQVDRWTGARSCHDIAPQSEFPPYCLRIVICTTFRDDIGVVMYVAPAALASCFAWGDSG